MKKIICLTFLFFSSFTIAQEKKKKKVIQILLMPQLALWI